MTKHFTPETLIDALDGPLTVEGAAHLAECQACTEELAEMRALAADVTLASSVPEPSPLFWDHLSARVREAVDARPVPVPWWHTAWRPAVGIVSMIGVLALAVWLRPAPAPLAGTSESPEVIAAMAVMSDEAEAVWDMISTLAPSIPVDDAVEAGLNPGRGATDAAIAALSGAERRELVKLLRAEMGSSE